MRLALNTLLALMLLVARANAFSLLGPYTDWMQYTNGFRQHGDIGGPMNLGEEYRWNVPVLTYGFDQSFLDYFGSNGVAAVEQAIQILNDLPPASDMVLTNFPPESWWVNWPAQADGLFDLKSAALGLVLEQMGLAQPTRNVFDLRTWDFAFLNHGGERSWRDWAIPNFIIERNFDPETLATSRYVNGNLFTGSVYAWGPLSPFPAKADVQERALDPFSSYNTAVADRPITWFSLYLGYYYTNLTRDDVGGLRYLLGTNNLNYETLLPGVRGVGTNAGAYVDGAWRPGVDKITFVRHPFDPFINQFAPLTNQYADSYLTNNVLVHQQLERLVSRPDFLLRADDTSDGHMDFDNPALGAWLTRTDTGNWRNQAASNGDATKPGPGVIYPPVTITFHKLGTYVRSRDTSSYLLDYRWGSFDAQTNAPVAYPHLPAAGGEMSLHLWLHDQNSAISPPIKGGDFKWQVPVTNGGRAILQSSTNLLNWTSLKTVTNRGAVVVWDNLCLGSPRFFRVLPQ